MNVIVSNKQQALLANLNIDILRQLMENSQPMKLLNNSAISFLDE